MKAAAIIVGCAAGVSAHQHYASGTGVCSAASNGTWPATGWAATAGSAQSGKEACDAEPACTGYGPTKHARSFGKVWNLAWCTSARLDRAR